MTVHPRHINRRFPKRSYVFEHRTTAFKGFICGVRFRDGISEPALMRKAVRLAGSMGGRMLRGHCVETGIRFGERAPDADIEATLLALVERADALGALEDEDREIDYADIVARWLEERAQRIGEGQAERDKVAIADMSDALDAREAQMREWLLYVVDGGDSTYFAAEGGNVQVLVRAPSALSDHNRAWCEDAVRALGYGGECEWIGDADDLLLVAPLAAPFSDDGPDPDEPMIPVSREALESRSWTKALIIDFARNLLALKLDHNANKGSLVNAVMAHPRVIDEDANTPEDSETDAALGAVKGEEE